MSYLNVKNLSCSFFGKKVLDGINFSLEDKDWLMVVGPNGSGKSSLINCISKTIKYTGLIECYGKNISDYRIDDFAKIIGFMFQKNYVNESLTVTEIVEMGRYCYLKGPFNSYDNNNDDLINQVLNICDLQEFKDREFSTLSGGESQRVYLALLLAQNPKILVLDEPLNNLDLVYQKQCMEILKKWKSKHEISIIMSIHDMSLAKRYGNKFLLLKNGHQLSFGIAEKALSKDNLCQSYGFDVVAYIKDINSLW